MKGIIEFETVHGPVTLFWTWIDEICGTKKKYIVATPIDERGEQPPRTYRVYDSKKGRYINFAKTVGELQKIYIEASP